MVSTPDPAGPAPRAAELEFDRSLSQTLSRGLQVLEVLAEAETPLTAQQIAARLGLARPVVYRLLRTLAVHHLLDADATAGRYELGVGLLQLARGVQKGLREAAYPILKQLANDVSGTAVLGLRDGEDVVYVLSVEPELARAAVRSREGARRPIASSTSGLALLSTHAPADGDPEALRVARTRGFAARTTDIAGYPATAIAAPVRSHGGPSDVCVTVLFPNVVADVDAVAARIPEAAARIAAVARV